MVELHNDTIKLIKLLENCNLNVNEVYKITENEYFMKLYNTFKELYNKILIDDDDINNNNNNNINIHIENASESPYFYLTDNDFTSDEIKLYILSNLKNGYKIIFENNTIIYFTKKNKVNLSLVKHMFKIIYILKNIFNRGDKSQTIIFFETDKKKKFPIKRKILGPNEINSGLTILDLHKNGNIILYRKEEVLKVLIHELVHSNLIDQKLIFSHNNNYFNKLICVNYDIVINEAFTEFFALILNIFYINIVNNLKINNLNTMFKNEIKYSFYISSKIFKYYNINNINEIIKNNNNCKITFLQNTNIFSYYILKKILLKDHLIIGKILDKYSENYKINNRICINKIIDLLITNIEQMKNNKYNSFDFYKNNSLRLCLYELKL
jgi:hypothetical protein